jgi:hypothetical protein
MATIMPNSLINIVSFQEYNLGCLISPFYLTYFDPISWKSHGNGKCLSRQPLRYYRQFQRVEQFISPQSGDVQKFPERHSAHITESMRGMMFSYDVISTEINFRIYIRARYDFTDIQCPSIHRSNP